MNSPSSNNQQPSNLITAIDDKIQELVSKIDSKVINQDNIELYERKIDKLLEIRETITNSANSQFNFEEVINSLLKPNPNSKNQNFDNQLLITNAAKYLSLLRNSTQSLEHEETKNEEMNKINDPALGLELFRTYRSIIEHEGTLLNARINYFLVAQAFLVTGFCTVIVKELALIGSLIIVIPSVGIVYSLIVIMPILLSIEAVDILKREWREEIYGEMKRTEKKYGEMKRTEKKYEEMKNKDDEKAITRQVKNLLPLQVCFDSEKYDEYIYHTKREPYTFWSRSSFFKWVNVSIPFIAIVMWLVIGYFFWPQVINRVHIENRSFEITR